jgi:MFS family permease
MLVEGAVALPFSHLSDRIGRRPVLILALLWLSVCCVGLGTASSVVSVVAWRVTGTC